MFNAALPHADGGAGSGREAQFADLLRTLPAKIDVESPLRELGSADAVRGPPLGSDVLTKPVRWSLVVERVGDDDVQHSQQLDLCGKQCLRRIHVRAMVEPERLPSDRRF